MKKLISLLLALVCSLISCAVLVVICAPCAYVLSRFTFFGNAAIPSGFVAAMGVPVAMIVLPLFCIIAQLYIFLSEKIIAGVTAGGVKG